MMARDFAAAEDSYSGQHRPTRSRISIVAILTSILAIVVPVSVSCLPLARTAKAATAYRIKSALRKGIKPK
jgi:hypothetical protein